MESRERERESVSERAREREGGERERGEKSRECVLQCVVVVGCCSVL